VTKARPVVETIISDNQPLPHPENSTQELALSSATWPEAIACATNMIDLPHELHLAIFEVLDETTLVCLGFSNKNF
jgi:hypothetical protein